MIKKILSLGLIVVLLFNLSGYFWIFRYNRYLVRTEVREWIRSGRTAGNEEIIIIDFPAHSGEFKWIDKKEFSYRGKMYDVISKKICGKSIIFRCINDKKEEVLYSQYNTWFQQHLPGETNGKANNTKAMLSHLIKHALIKGSFSFFVPYMILNDPYFRVLQDNNSLTPPPSPPPESCC